MPTPPDQRETLTGEVTLRLARGSDSGALQRLAGLDSRRLPPGPHLVATTDGRLDGALSLSTGEVVADPFRPTLELVELLRHRASRSRSGRRRPRSRGLPLRPRPASA